MTIPDKNYFPSINSLLKQNGIARPCVFVDMNRLDHNIKLIEAQLSDPFQFRLVTKSLPCPDLIRYILRQTKTNRLMAFHQPFLYWMIEELPEVDILLGKPLLIAAVVEFFNKISVPNDAASRVQWLVDTPDRLHEHGEFASHNDLTLRINLEIDIGLGRGGLGSPVELENMLTILSSYPANLTFSGFMGYDAHVPYVSDDITKSFSEAMNQYASFIAEGRRLYPELFASNLTLNSGGSKTWQLFSGEQPVNDVAFGSALLKPAAFSSLKDHQPALYLAAPCIKQFERRHLSKRNPHLDTCNYLYGGGWAAETVYPQEVEISSQSDPPNENLLPNQSLYFTNHQSSLGIGDFVFFQPRQSDALFQFEEILVIADGKIIDTWKPLPRRF